MSFQLPTAAVCQELSEKSSPGSLPLMMSRLYQGAWWPSGGKRLSAMSLGVIAELT